MEKSETILTVTDCHRCCREDTKSSVPDAKYHSSRGTRRSENEAEGPVSSRAARLQCPKSCRKELGIASRDLESFFPLWSPHSLALRASRSSPSSGLAGPGPEIWRGAPRRPRWLGRKGNNEKGRKQGRGRAAAQGKAQPF